MKSSIKYIKLIIIIMILTTVLIVLSFYGKKINLQVSKKENLVIKNQNFHPTIETFEIDNFYESNIINNNLNDITDTYPEFISLLKSANITLPLLDEMIPQGLTIMNNYILITAYDPNGQNNSLIYVLNKIGKVINKITLNTTSHVGSIVYDNINNLLWLPDNDGILNAYDAKDFINNKYVIPKYQFKNISTGLFNYIDESKEEIAYLCIDNNMLYIGSFANRKKGKIKKYLIKKENQEIKLEFKKEYICPYLVQGMTFYNDINNKYLILSTSYGQKNNSSLKVYKFDDTKDDISLMQRVEIILPPMLEQVMIKGDNLYILFESIATKYQETPVKIKEICGLDINKIIAKFNN